MINYYDKYIKYKIKYLMLKMKQSVNNRSSDKKTIIITAPHIKCNNTEENMCDQTSGPYALMIKSIFENMGHTVIYLPATIHRSECDLNRLYCRTRQSQDSNINLSDVRDQQYVEDFIRIVRENPNAYHLDIHSFPYRESFSSNNDIILGK